MTKRFHISGMNCASCVNHIERDVSALSGVHHIMVNFASEQAEVMFDETKLSAEQIMEEIKKTGYTATIAGESSTQDAHGGGHVMPDGTTMSGEDHSAHVKAENAAEIQSKFQKVLIGAVLSIGIVFLTFFVDLQNDHALMLVLTLTILVYTGNEFYIRGIPPFLRRGRPNMDTLVAVGVSAAFLFSIYSIFIKGAEEEYFLDSAVITTFVMLGRFLEAKAKGRASEAIKKLLQLSAKMAHRVSKNGTEDVPIDRVQKGDLLLVKPGEKVPVDGVITEGEATLDESMVTGESIPVDKKNGDPLIGATLNGNTSFTMRAEKVGKETLLAHIIQLVEQAQMSKAPIQKLADKISEYFVWGVMIIALGTFVVWYLTTGNWENALIPTVAVMIIACPCALGLATPISIVVGSGKGASLGILMKKAEALEKIHKIKVICFDKTGTITKGHPEVKSFQNTSSVSDQEVLSIARTLEEHSEHPLAKSVVDFTKQKNINSASVNNFKAITGKGVSGTISGKSYHLGSVGFMKSLGIALDPVMAIVDELRRNGQTMLLVSNNQAVLGMFGVQDQVKKSSKQAISLLHHRGIKTVMMTGDHETVAKAIAKEVGIDEVLAEITPEGKTAKINELRDQGQIVAMVGDGINDSPALSASDVGIAMGTGTDIAIESGDVVLVKGDLMKAVEAIELSEATLRNIKQNLFWAFVYNTVGIPVAALGFLNPIISSLAMAFSSVSVVLNALRLKRFQVKQ